MTQGLTSGYEVIPPFSLLPPNREILHVFDDFRQSLAGRECA